MSDHEKFLKWLIEDEDVSVNELFKKFGVFPSVVAILRFYDQWKKKEE